MGASRERGECERIDPGHQLKLLRLLYYRHPAQVTSWDPTLFLWVLPKIVLVSVGESCSRRSTNPLSIPRYTTVKLENFETMSTFCPGIRGKRVGVMGNWCLFVLCLLHFIDNFPLFRCLVIKRLNFVVHCGYDRKSKYRLPLVLSAGSESILTPSLLGCWPIPREVLSEA